ncbi:nucleotide pyrophosphohydrolase [Listeria monocytogenes]|nr:nucleotide pyrophosphohydrolase [Listeria monocytogenes]
MTLREYQIRSMRTNTNRELGDVGCLLNFALGTTGEAGEVADLVKKYVFHEHELDTHELILELGDVMWYVSQLALTLGVSLDEVAERNINKIESRYPDGFNKTDSINRRENG